MVFSTIAFYAGIFDFLKRVKDTYQEMAEDKWVYIVPAILAFVLGLCDLISAEWVTYVMYVVVAGVYGYMFYRYCQRLLAKDGKQPSGIQSYIHAIAKSFIFTIISVVAVLLISIIPYVTIGQELVPVLITTLLYYGIFMFVYPTVMILYPKGCE